MNGDSVFERVKAAVRIDEVVEWFGVKLDRHGKAKCPFHQEKTASFSVKREDSIFHCFGCHAGGDAIDFVAKLKGIESIAAARLLAEMYGVCDQPHRERKAVAKKPVPEAKNTPQRATMQIKEYITSCIAAVGQTDYFKRRGLSEESIHRFHLGYDADKQAVVIPYSYKLDYYQTRSVNGKEFRKPKSDEAGVEPIYNAEVMYKTKGAVFAVESPICAMSIMQGGGLAISTCGTGTIKLVTAIKQKKPDCIFVLCMDNDTAGEAAQNELMRSLLELNVKFIAYNMAGEHKDPNELLMADPNALAINIKEATAAANRKYRTAKDSVTAKEICEKNHTKPRQVVDNLIVEGLTLFCAPQKIGKSWLVLDLCFTVAQGFDFWAYRTERCDTLYYCLEDPDWRIDDRIKKLYGRCPTDRVSFIFEADKLGEGFLEHLTVELERNPKIGMVVVDTLKMIRKANSKNNDIYGHDYEELNALKKFAEKHKIALIIVHHTRKTKDESDPFANVLGTGGMTGAVDTTLVLMKRKRADRESVLSVTGRDVQERELIVEFGVAVNWKWALQGNAEDMQKKWERDEFEKDPLVKTIKALLEAQPYGWTGTPTELTMRVYDMTGDMSQTPNGIGARITKWKTKLYFEGIDHSEKKVRGQKKHTFFKRSLTPPQWSVLSDKDE
jgi:hypothetical protein